MKKNILSEDIFIIENFMTQKECDDLIIYSELKGFEEATVTTNEGQKMIKGIRNNQRVIVTDAQLANRLWSIIQPFVHFIFDEWLPVGVNEQFRFYKYAVGERFNKHLDGRYKRNENEESRLTFMIYLNDNFEGGETEFEKVTVVPKTGLAVVFRHEIRHKGCEVTTGEKYALRTDIMFRNK